MFAPNQRVKVNLANLTIQPEIKGRIPRSGSSPYPTNSLIISGPPAAVEKLIDIIK